MHALKHAALAKVIENPRSVQALAAELGLTVDALVSCAIVDVLQGDKRRPSSERFEEAFPAATTHLKDIWPTDCRVCLVSVPVAEITRCSACGTSRCRSCSKDACSMCSAKDAKTARAQELEQKVAADNERARQRLETQAAKSLPDDALAAPGI